MRTIKVLCFVALIAFLAFFTYAMEETRIAKVTDVNGRAEVRPFGQENWVPMETGMIINQGDVIRTDMGSKVTLNLNGAGETGIIEVMEDSEMLLLEMVKDKMEGREKTLLDLAVGEVLIKAGKLQTSESRFEVKTPNSIVGVRGTKFSVKVEALE